MDKKVIEEFVKTLTEEDIERFKEHDYTRESAELGDCIASDMDLIIRHPVTSSKFCPTRYSRLCFRINRYIKKAYQPKLDSLPRVTYPPTYPPCPCGKIKRALVSEFTMHVLKRLGVDPIC